MEHSMRQLQTSLRAVLPGASLVIQALPDVPELKLLLLDEDYPRGELSQELITASGFLTIPITLTSSMVSRNFLII